MALALQLLAVGSSWPSLVPPHPTHVPEPYYAVEVDRAGVGGFNVLFDGHNHPETTDFAINNGPSFVRMLDGTDALVIRSCVNRTGCSKLVPVDLRGSSAATVATACPRRL
jgi:hypothetical protein